MNRFDFTKAYTSKVEKDAYTLFIFRTFYPTHIIHPHGNLATTLLCRLDGAVYCSKLRKHLIDFGS